MKDCARPRFETEAKDNLEMAYKPVSQSCAVAEIKKNSGGSLKNQTWQTEWKTVPLAKVQLCEYENQTLEAFVAEWPAEFFTFSFSA